MQEANKNHQYQNTEVLCESQKTPHSHCLYRGGYITNSCGTTNEMGNRMKTESMVVSTRGSDRRDGTRPEYRDGDRGTPETKKLSPDIAVPSALDTVWGRR